MGFNFFFYDLETSGIYPKEDRIMQFAGQRTDENLKIIGQPYNYLIKMTEDILPDPQAILVTGITPQQTQDSGLTEAAFLTIFHEQIAIPGTIFIGYNNIQFDDEFMRYMNYRNYYDPYEWQWQNNKSRWDLLNIIRMMRALRPEGIKWPVDAVGKPTNRLEELAKANGLDHVKAHDALSDVKACIALAKLIKDTQPKLYSYLFNIRDKRDIARLVTSGKPFVFVGSYQGEHERTSVFNYLFEPNSQEAMLFDLRYNPLDFIQLTAERIVELWLDRYNNLSNPLPLRTIRYNRCPAVAPLEVLDEASQVRLKLDLKQLNLHRQLLKDNLPTWLPILQKINTLKDKANRQRKFGYAASVDSLLYGSFFNDADRELMIETRSISPKDLKLAKFHFADQRLRQLLPLYKARNYPESLTPAEQIRWEAYRQRHLLQGGAKSRYATFVIRLQSLAETNKLKARDKILLTEIDAWSHQLLPSINSQSARLGQ